MENDNGIKVRDGQDLSVKPSNAEDPQVAGKSEPYDGDYHGIDTRALPVGADLVYERKVAVMNRALIDIGMGPFQWKVFAMTGFGWFVDNVRSPLAPPMGIMEYLSTLYTDWPGDSRIVLDASHYHHQHPSAQ